MALILGAHYLFHDTCFTLVKDGQILGVYEAERFNKVKMGRAVNSFALDALLEDHGVTLNDLDLVGATYHPSYWPLRRQQVCGQWGDNHQQAAMVNRSFSWMMNAQLHALKELVGRDEIVIPVRHHMAHLAGVFYPSDCEDAIIMSVDGAGESESTTIAQGVCADIDILTHNSFPDSLGFIYFLATEWLGWGVGEEGKTMALASYGEPRFLDVILDRFMDLEETGFFKQKNYPTFKAFLRDIVGPDRLSNEPLTQVHKDVAASVQQLTNIIMVRLARFCRKISDSENLIITGGVALNSVANGKIMNEKLFKLIHAYPHANDVGVSIGAALWLERQRVGNDNLRRNASFKHAYLGRNIDQENLVSCAAKMGLSHKTVDDPACWAAERISEGKIVGFIQGSAELGPRALGNRSILANPLLPEIKDTINEKIKNREIWRPFAPSVLEEDAAEYFDVNQPLPYMIIVADVVEKWREKLKAIAHVDHTARVQTVAKDINPTYHALLSHLKKLTGVGMVLNTSFNDRGEPIINTVEQALKLFLRSEMDCLVIGDQVFSEKLIPETPRQHFSPFDYFSSTLNKSVSAGCRSLFVGRHSKAEPLAAFMRLFIELHQEGYTIVFDDETLSKTDRAEIVACLPSKAETFSGKQPFEGQDVLLLGPLFESYWIMNEQIACDPVIDRYLTLAEVVGGKAIGADSQAGLVDLKFVQHIRGKTLMVLDK